MTMANTYMSNDRLNLELYRDFLRASIDLTKQQRLKMILKRKHKTLIKKP